MRIIFFIISFLLSTGFNAHAADIYLLDFKLMKDNKVINLGKANVSSKLKIWSNGLSRSYLKLHCKELGSGKIEKRLSTENHFNGLMVAHKISDGTLNLKVSRHVITPRFVEIRALAKDKCKELLPIVTITTENYSFPAIKGISESRPFGNDMIFNFKLETI